MKICLLNSLYPPYTRGGAEKVCVQMAQNLRDKGHDVFIISGRPRQPIIQNNSHERLHYIDSDFYNLNKKPALSRLLWHLQNIFSFKSLREVSKILKKEEPDLIISHNLIGLGFLSARAIKSSGISHHHFIHDIQLLHPSGLMIYGKERELGSVPARIYRFILKNIIASPDKIISPSRWLLAEHRKYNFFADSETEIQRLDDIFAQGKAVASLAAAKPISKSTTLLFAGQIEEHKGIIFLVQAFLKLAPPELSLKIAGTGSKLGEIKKIIASDKRIRILGNLNKTDLEKEIRGSLALIVPSLCYENSPLIISEAKALGLLVIASRIGGITEATPNPELLFTPGSEEDLFDKIKSVL